MPPNMRKCGIIMSHRNTFRSYRLDESQGHLRQGLERDSEANGKQVTGVRAKTIGRRRTIGQGQPYAMYRLKPVRTLGGGYWEAVDDQDVPQAVRDLNVAGTVVEQRRHHIRARQYHRKVLERGR